MSNRYSQYVVLVKYPNRNLIILSTVNLTIHCRTSIVSSEVDFWITVDLIDKPRRRKRMIPKQYVSFLPSYHLKSHNSHHEFEGLKRFRCTPVIQNSSAVI